MNIARKLGVVQTVVYGYVMAQKLSKQRWLQHGLETLTKSGFTAIKAELMANALKVSRGSFYWHFKNIKVFHSELLQYWRRITTLQVIDNVDKHSVSDERLELLMQRAFLYDNKLERAIRAWATQNKDVASVVEKVDLERIAYILELITSSGTSDSNYQARAAFIYWAYLGRLMAVGDQAKAISVNQIDMLSDWLTTS